MVRKYKTKRYYSSSAPDGDDWTTPDLLSINNKRTFYICIKKQLYDGWLNIKLFSTQKEKSKAAFWLNYNGERFSNGKDQLTLNKNYPELKERLIEYLENKLPTDYFYNI